ncbi:MFS transporter [Thalassobaculum sp. OXR-137]|uniref:MFS transporter n=1 Tax=Thalassobaculum sp. OXR-137 TaxID=3100173 RepID=UPI002AC942E6|nr:MFS transporter [Thalassobaculum sp. OXR-137]WPZ33668.1 MFS transporter [Thalassobaculum sp. OXR-137]
MKHAPSAATGEAATGPSAQDVEDGLPVPRRYVAIFALLVTLMMVVLDGAIANVALPTIHAELQASTAKTVWMVTAYQLVLVMALLPAAFLGEAIGPRRLFTVGVTVFTLASGLCALAPSIDWLIAARVLQAFGAAPIMSLTIALLRYSLPAHMIGMYIGVNSMVVALSSAAGPAIGAAILSVASWPWLFAINVPIGLVVLLASTALAGPRGSGRRADVPAMAMNAGAFALLVLGAGRVATEPWQGCGMLVLSVVTFGLLVRREWHREVPVIPLDLLRRQSFRLSVLASIFLFMAFMASFVSLPFLFQHGFGLPAWETGLAMTAWPLALAVSGPIAGRVSDRVDTAWLCAVGALTMAVGLGIAAAFPIGLAPLLACMALTGLGFGFVQVPNNRNMLMSVPRERAGAAGGSQGTARLLGQTFGGLAVGILFTVLPDDTVPRYGLAIAACAAACSALVSLRRALGRGT